MHKPRLVARHVSVRKTHGTQAVPSGLDDHEVVCVLERLDTRRWRARAQLEGATTANYNDQPRKFAPKIIRPSTGDNAEEAKQLAREYIIACVSGIAERFGRGKKVGIFGDVKWEDAVHFRLR